MAKMAKAVLMAVVVGALMLASAARGADNCASYFVHVGEKYTDKVSGGWHWCGVVSDGCAPLSRFLSHADASAFGVLLDDIGRRITPASQATYNDVPFKKLLDVIQPGHTC